MLLTVTHITRYTFDTPVTHGLQRLKLRPKTTHGQEVVDWIMDLTGARTEADYHDHHDSHTTLVSIAPGADEVVVQCRGTVRTSDNNGITGNHTGLMPLWTFLRPTRLTRAGPRVRALVEDVDADPRDPLEFLHALSRKVAERIAYVPGATDAKTTAEEALTAGKGVCQDQAHAFISAGRLLDIPVRYVGGYLKMNDREEQEAGHGWAEAYVTGLGWVGFDVANAMCPDERYIRVATGCDYGEAAPVTGIAMGGGDSRLEVRLSVGEKVLGQQQQQQSSAGGQQQQRG
ncbi:transglutaminase-like putative cysteine protease [Novosphingobium sp. PhB165]|uniref:transglutaminase family protein n=1 Tax=Novosphingobium sp. PhB165 TaxID=2485105 RepID=UPI001053788C|nr:transglutaminase family protein [Novosphingobium sp. PhB165]TCM19916.1 transglutaminase-like putative cysteine protease [Novosphingobium sp. PhB165]